MNPTLNSIISQHMKPGFVMAEIGTWDGESVKGYADLLRSNNGFIYLVDWFMGNPTADGPHQFQQVKRVDVMALLLEAVKSVGHVLLDGPSSVMIPRIPDRSLDFAFIDADHRYSAARSDIDQLLPKIKQGGIICGHDFENPGVDLTKTFTAEEYERDMARGYHCGVAKAVYEIFPVERIIPMPDAVWMVKL